MGIQVPISEGVSFVSFLDIALQLVMLADLHDGIVISSRFDIPMLLTVVVEGKHEMWCVQGACVVGKR